MKLYNYFRSSASFRVRIALALKGLPYDYIPVNLLKGEQHTDAFAAISPTALVPSLVTDEGLPLGQSMAIIEYLDEVHPEPPCCRAHRSIVRGCAPWRRPLPAKPTPSTICGCCNTSAAS